MASLPSAVCQAGITQLNSEIGVFLGQYSAQNAACTSSCDPAVSNIPCSAECSLGLRDLETNCHDAGGHVYQQLVSVTCGANMRQTRTYDCYPSACQTPDINAFAAKASNATCTAARQTPWVTGCSVSIVEDDAYANGSSGAIIAGVVVGIVFLGLFAYLGLHVYKRMKGKGAGGSGDGKQAGETVPILSQLIQQHQLQTAAGAGSSGGVGVGIGGGITAPHQQAPQQTNYQLRASLYKPASAGAAAPGIVLRGGGGDSGHDAELALLSSSVQAATVLVPKAPADAISPLGDSSAVSPAAYDAMQGQQLQAKSPRRSQRAAGEDDDDEDEDEDDEGGARKANATVAQGGPGVQLPGAVRVSGPKGGKAAAASKLKATHGNLKPAMSPAAYEEARHRASSAAADSKGRANESTDLDTLAAAVKRSLKKGSNGPAVASASGASLSSLSGALLADESEADKL